MSYNRKTPTDKKEELEKLKNKGIDPEFQDRIENLTDIRYSDKVVKDETNRNNLRPFQK